MSSFHSDYLDLLVLLHSSSALCKEFPVDDRSKTPVWRWHDHEDGIIHRHVDFLWTNRHRLYGELKFFPEISLSPTGSTDLMLWLRERRLLSRNVAIPQERRVHACCLMAPVWTQTLHTLASPWFIPETANGVKALATERFSLLSHSEWDAPIVRMNSMHHNRQMQHIWFTFQDLSQETDVLQRVIQDSVNSNLASEQKVSRKQQIILPLFRVTKILQRIPNLPFSVELLRDFVGQHLGEVGVDFRQTIDVAIDCIGANDHGVTHSVQNASLVIGFDKPFVMWITRRNMSRPLFILEVDPESFVDPF